QLTLLTPFHGTALWRQMAKKGLIEETDLSKFDLYHMTWRHPTIAKDEMRDLLAWAQRTVNRPEFMAEEIKKDLKLKFKQSLERRRGQPAFAQPIGATPADTPTHPAGTH